MNQPDKGTLLIVDDEALKRATLDIELSAAGYRVLQAPDAATALQYMEEQSVDVVITDWRMPEMDGIQLLEQIKTRWPHVHVMLMTAYGTVDSAVRAMKNGACDYLTKPFAAEALLRRLEQLRSPNGTEGDSAPTSEEAAPAVAGETATATAEGQDAGADVVCGINFKLPEAVAGVEKSLIDAALRRAAGNQAKAAQYLGIPRTTLRDKLAKYGLTSEPVRSQVS
ncbi:MAG: response regulator [Phycisphaerae bacterium]|nr:response regulator [Phycisphaerae bacterium]